MSESPEDTMPMASYLDLLNERDELLEALKGLMDALDKHLDSDDDVALMVQYAQAEQRARAIINKSTQ